MVKVPLMVVKPVLKKVIKAVDKGRKDVRKFRKDKEKESSPSTTALNKAQERLETLRDVKDVTLKVLKKKLPKEAMTSLKKTFEDAAKKRATIRNIMADPKKLKRKPNFKGGLIKKPRLAKRGF